MTSELEQPDTESPAASAGGRAGLEDGLDNRVLAALGYLPMLFFVPLVAARGNRYAEFHGRQSLVLFLLFAVLWVGVWFVSLILGRILGEIVLLGFLFKALGWLVYNGAGGLLALGYLAAMVFGIAQAASGYRKRMPFIGSYAGSYWSP